jgi:hypothetical protein
MLKEKAWGCFTQAFFVLFVLLFSISLLFMLRN